MRYSANQFAKAMNNAPSDQAQAQAMEQINVDVVDIVNQVMELDKSFVKVPCNTVDDVKYLVAQAALRLRVLLGLLVDQAELREEIHELKCQVESLEDEIDFLKSDYDQ